MEMAIPMLLIDKNLIQFYLQQKYNWEKVK